MRSVRAIGVLASIFVAGFVAFGWAWHGAKHARYVSLQTPWVVSGGLAGIALVGLAVVSWQIFLTRRDDAAHREEWDDFTRAAIEVLASCR